MLVTAAPALCSPTPCSHPWGAAAAVSRSRPHHRDRPIRRRSRATAESYEAARRGHDRAAGPEIDERDIALIMYTSGTTGRPKGAMLTHLNLLMQAFTTLRTDAYGDDNVNLLNVPLFHIAGVGNLVPPFMLGSTSVIMPTAPFDAEATLDVVESEKVTACSWCRRSGR